MRARLAHGELVESNAGADKCGALIFGFFEAVELPHALISCCGPGYLAQSAPRGGGWTRRWAVLYTAQKRLDFYAHAEDVASHKRMDRVDLTGTWAGAANVGWCLR